MSSSSAPATGSATVAAGVAAGNINVAPPVAERATMELSDVSRAAGEQHAQLLLSLEASRLARFAAAPTDPDAVKLRLRAEGQPVTLFGEGPGERRERLKRLMGEAQVAEMVRARGAASGGRR